MSQAVEKNKLVTLSVAMADMTGKVIEETGPEGITYLHGHGDIFPKIEAALEGRFVGEGFTIALQPEDAFGQYDAEAIRMVPVSMLRYRLMLIDKVARVLVKAMSVLGIELPERM